MHENETSHAIIGAAIEVHREVGPGIIEKPYEEAMCHELHLLTYLRLLNLRFGLVINFHVAVLKNGICRVVNNLFSTDAPPEPLTSIRRSLRPPRLCVSAL